jgi:hypothetical protein
MAGTLTISTLSDGTNSTSATNCIQGSAKAWVNFNGTNGAIRAAYNVSSVTKTGSGTYTANFTNAFVDANYSVSSCAGWGATGAPTGLFCLTIGAVVPTASAVGLAIFISTGAASEPPFANISVFR